MAGACLRVYETLLAEKRQAFFKNVPHRSGTVLERVLQETAQRG